MQWWAEKFPDNGPYAIPMGRHNKGPLVAEPGPTRQAVDNPEGTVRLPRNGRWIRCSNLPDRSAVPHG